MKVLTEICNIWHKLTKKNKTKEKCQSAEIYVVQDTSCLQPPHHCIHALSVSNSTHHVLPVTTSSFQEAPQHGRHSANYTSSLEDQSHHHGSLSGCSTSYSRSNLNLEGSSLNISSLSEDHVVPPIYVAPNRRASSVVSLHCLEDCSSFYCDNSYSLNSADLFQSITTTAVTTPESSVCRGSHFDSPKDVQNLGSDLTQRSNQMDILECTEVEIDMGQHHSKHKQEGNKRSHKPTTDKQKKPVGSHQFQKRRRFDEEHMAIGMRIADSNEKHHLKRNGWRGKMALRKKTDVFKHISLNGKESLRRKPYLKSLNGKENLRRKAHVFHLKSWGGKDGLRRKAHVFHLKSWGGKDGLRRKAHVFHMKSWDGKDGLRRKAHVFHLKSWGGKDGLRRKAHVFHMKSWGGKDGLRRKAHVFHMKSWGGKDGLRRKAHVFHMKSWGGKDGLRRKAHVFHMKSWNGNESLRRKAHVFHMKSWGGKDGLRRKAHVFHIKSWGRKDSWKSLNKDHSFCKSILDWKCCRKNSENKKRKKQIKTKRKVRKQSMDTLQQTVEIVHLEVTTKQRLTFIGSAYDRRPGGRPSPGPSRSQVLQPRSRETKQDAQYRLEQPQRIAAHHDGQPSEQVAQLINVPHQLSEQDVKPGVQQAGEGVWPYSAEFQKMLPSAEGFWEFKRRRIMLINTCQLDCILLAIFLLVWFDPQMEQTLRNANEQFQWLYGVWMKCKAGKFNYAKRFFWLKHGKAHPENDFANFKINLEADWILKPLEIKIFEKMSNCTNGSCAFAEEDLEVPKDFKDSIEAFARRCLTFDKLPFVYANFQDVFKAWSAEDVPCSECDGGYRRVTRRLDCDQGPPPLLPVQTFFEESASSSKLGEFLLPVHLDGGDLTPPEEFVTEYQRYRLHAVSYAITIPNRTGKDCIHERCKVWDDKHSQWLYYDGAGWTIHGATSSYKLKMSADTTPGKSYRVAYFKQVRPSTN